MIIRDHMSTYRRSRSLFFLMSQVRDFVLHLTSHVWLPLLRLMAATSTTSNYRTRHRRRLRCAFGGRLNQALFVVDLQVQGLRSAVDELRGAAVLKQPLSRDVLLNFSPLQTSTVHHTSWNVEAACSTLRL